MNSSDTYHTSIREERRGSTFYRWNAAILREITPEIFSPIPAADHTVNRLGRGAVVMFHYLNLHIVLRHYQRGGLVRFFNRDLYPFFTTRAYPHVARVRVAIATARIGSAGTRPCRHPLPKNFIGFLPR